VRWEIHTKFWSENLQGKHTEYLRVNGMIILQWALNKMYGC